MRKTRKFISVLLVFAMLLTTMNAFAFTSTAAAESAVNEIAENSWGFGYYIMDNTNYTNAGATATLAANKYNYTGVAASPGADGYKKLITNDTSGWTYDWGNVKNGPVADSVATTTENGFQTATAATEYYWRNHFALPNGFSAWTDAALEGETTAAEVIERLFGKHEDTTPYNTSGTFSAAVAWDAFEKADYAEKNNLTDKASLMTPAAMIWTLDPTVEGSTLIPGRTYNLYLKGNAWCGIYGAIFAIQDADGTTRTNPTSGRPIGGQYGEYGFGLSTDRWHGWEDDARPLYDKEISIYVPTVEEIEEGTTYKQWPKIAVSRGLEGSYVGSLNSLIAIEDGYDEYVNQIDDNRGYTATFVDDNGSVITKIHYDASFADNYIPKNAFYPYANQSDGSSSPYYTQNKAFLGLIDPEFDGKDIKAIKFWTDRTTEVTKLPAADSIIIVTLSDEHPTSKDATASALAYSVNGAAAVAVNGFAADSYEYTVNLPADAATVSLVATATAAGITTVAYDAPNGAVTFDLEDNSAEARTKAVKATLTAENGAVLNYTVTFVRKPSLILTSQKAGITISPKDTANAVLEFYNDSIAPRYNSDVNQGGATRLTTNRTYSFISIGKNLLDMTLITRGLYDIGGPSYIESTPGEALYEFVAPEAGTLYALHNAELPTYTDADGDGVWEVVNDGQDAFGPNGTTLLDEKVSYTYTADITDGSKAVVTSGTVIDTDYKNTIPYDFEPTIAADGSKKGAFVAGTAHGTSTGWGQKMAGCDFYYEISKHQGGTRTDAPVFIETYSAYQNPESVTLKWCYKLDFEAGDVVEIPCPLAYGGGTSLSQMPFVFVKWESDGVSDDATVEKMLVGGNEATLKFDVYEYVAETAEEVSIVPVTTSSWATYTVEPATAVPTVAGTEVAVTVEAENGTTADYIVLVKKAASTNAAASELKYSINGAEAVAVPGFAANNYTYDVEVPAGTTSIALEAIPAVDSANVVYNPAGGTVAFDGTEKTITATLTAEDGTTVLAYTVNFTPEKVYYYIMDETNREANSSISANGQLFARGRLNTVTDERAYVVANTAASNDDLASAFGTALSGVGAWAPIADNFAAVGYNGWQTADETTEYWYKALFKPMTFNNWASVKNAEEDNAAFLARTFFSGIDASGRTERQQAWDAFQKVDYAKTNGIEGVTTTTTVVWTMDPTNTANGGNTLQQGQDYNLYVKGSDFGGGDYGMFLVAQNSDGTIILPTDGDTQTRNYGFYLNKIQGSVWTKDFIKYQNKTVTVHVPTEAEVAAGTAQWPKVAVANSHSNNRGPGLDCVVAIKAGQDEGVDAVDDYREYTATFVFNGETVTKIHYDVEFAGADIPMYALYAHGDRNVGSIYLKNKAFVELADPNLDGTADFALSFLVDGEEITTLPAEDSTIVIKQTKLGALGSLTVNGDEIEDPITEEEGNNTYKVEYGVGAEVVATGAGVDITYAWVSNADPAITGTTNVIPNDAIPATMTVTVTAQAGEAVKVYKINITEDKPQSTITVAVKDDKGTISAVVDGAEAVDWAASKTESIERGTMVELTAVATEGYEFDHWVDDATNMTLSVEATYSFAVGMDRAITAVFKKATFESGDTKSVLFRNRNGIVHYSAEIAAESDFTVPQNPRSMGYEFQYWKNEEGVQQTFAAGDVVGYDALEAYNLYLAYYTKIAQDYTVVVNNGTGSGTYKYNDKVTVVADEAPAGQVFAGWADALGNIVSYSSTYQFYAGAQLTVELTATYADVAPEQDAFIKMSHQIRTDMTGAVAVFAERYLPESMGTLLEAGILFHNSEAAPTLETSGVLVGKANRLNVSQLVVTKKGCENGDVWNTRGYMVYEDQYGNVRTYYSDPYPVTYTAQ